MSPVATVMIHEAWGGAMGPASELRAYADVLDMENANLARLYAAKTGKSEDEMRAFMADETWMNAQEALAMKIVDGIDQDDDDDEDENDYAKAAFPMAAAAERTHRVVALTQADRQAFIVAAHKAKAESDSRFQHTPGKPGSRPTGKPVNAPTK